jgi:poly [ADP-ribose] polymerase
MEEKSPVYLVMVTTNNNNKYYRMIPHGDTFEAEYGRVGASCQHASYSMSQWNKKYNEKIKKGYVDQTHLVQDLIQKEKPKGKDGYKEIENKVIAEIVQRLQDMAHQKIQANYKVSSQQVTQAMVDEAQKVIDRLMQREEVEDFNNTLLELFSVIPRKMGNVNDYLSRSKEDFARILKDEQDLLDVMRGQVVTHTVQDEPDTDDVEEKQETIIEAMGLEFEEVTEDDVR